MPEIARLWKATEGLLNYRMQVFYPLWNTRDIKKLLGMSGASLIIFNIFVSFSPWIFLSKYCPKGICCCIVIPNGRWGIDDGWPWNLKLYPWCRISCHQRRQGRVLPALQLHCITKFQADLVLTIGDNFIFAEFEEVDEKRSEETGISVTRNEANIEVSSSMLSMMIG